jgi:cytoskeletal protein CcmA (bactofilin family)
MRMRGTGARSWLGWGVIMVLLLIVVAPVSAAERRSGDRVVVGAGEVVVDDLYAAADTVTIDGTVKGDLIAAASQIVVNGTIEGDVLAVGQALVINGTVGDDLRAAGTAIQFRPRARIGDDALSAASSIEQQANGTIGGDAYLAASQALLAGMTHGELQGVFAALALRGTIERDVNVAVGARDGGVVIAPWTTGTGIATPAVPAGLTVDHGARIGGTLTYNSPQNATIDPAARIAAGVAYIPTPGDEPPASSMWLVDLLRRYLTLLVIGALLLWLTPSWIGRLSTTVQTQPLPSLGWGTLGFVGAIALLVLIPLVAILLMIVFGSLTLGGLAAIVLVLATAAWSALLTGFAVVVSYVVQVVVGLLVGRWLLGRVNPQWAEGRWGPLALGLAVYVVLRAVPILGVLVALVITLLGLGAIWQWARTRLAMRSAAPLTVAPQS